MSTRRAQKAAAIRSALAFDTSPEARKARKALSNTWMRRTPNVRAVHKPKGVSAPAMQSGKNRAHLVTSL